MVYDEKARGMAVGGTGGVNRGAIIVYMLTIM